MLFSINSWDAVIEATEDFAGICVGQASEVPRGDRVADESDFVADEGFMVADVDHELIHADAASDGVMVGAEKDGGLVGEGARVTVAIADWDGDDTGLLVRFVEMAVANARIWRNNFEIRDMRFKGETGAEVGMMGAVGRYAIAEEAGADHVKVRVGVEECAARVGDVPEDMGVGDLGLEGMEGVDLGLDERMIWLVGGGEVRVDAGDFKIGIFQKVVVEVKRGRGSHASPVHPGIDLEVNANPIP